MKQQSLNGIWMRRIGAGEEREQAVPYSTLPVGRSTCRRSFSVEDFFERLFLRFDGVTYRGDVTLNGVYLGRMLPYCEYEFEITDLVRRGENELSVELEDINLAFGPTPGWENFGGIIRDVSLIYREKTYVSGVFFKSKLINGYQDAEITVDVELDGEPVGDISIELTDPSGVCVLSYQQENGESKTETLKNVSLWSPETPALYTLRVSIPNGEDHTCCVGLRELACERHRFTLNGKPLFLKGLCKHEMIGDGGHVVSYEQMEADMKMIKSTGSNFVRLVHYPHTKAILDIADSIGLMVSEEPGLWWSDTSDPEVASGSIEVLRRTIRRDRNHPSIVFWLCFNECKFTEQFLIDSANACHECDPTRPVSGANCMSDEDTLIYYNKCKFDFYTMHPYSATFDRAQRSAEILHDKPLVFTEWGGYYVFDNPQYMRESIRKMADLYHANSDEGALAGAFLWAWADVNDFNRGNPCVDGLLSEGIVTKDRQKHICYDIFCEEIAKIEEPRAGSPYRYEQYSTLGGKLTACLTEGRELDAPPVYTDETCPPQFLTMRKRKPKIGPKLEREEVKGIALSPKMLCDGETLVYAGGEDVSKITLLGLTCLNKAYPIGGSFEEEVATVTVVTETGEQTHVLRNGREVTTAFATLGSSRIDPVADKAPRFASFSYDRNYEIYVINRLDLPMSAPAKVKEIRITSNNNGYNLLLYGVACE
jgi:hypothetical protein